jgi:hypothetical protein
MKIAGLEGFEPSANRLRADCSSLAELQALLKESISSNIRYYLGLTMKHHSQFNIVIVTETEYLPIWYQVHYPSITLYPFSGRIWEMTRGAGFPF